MKILFTADLHIRIGQKNIPKAWAIKQYEQMFAEIDRVFREHECQVEVHGGDIFDKVPTMEELNLYLKNVIKYERPRIIYDGNHEATKKGDTFLKYLEFMLPASNILVTSYSGFHQEWGWNFDILPYCDLHKLKDIEPRNKLLFTHVRGEIPPHVKPEVDLDLFDKWDLVLAGDLHAHSNSQRNIIYPGSPRTVTFHRKNVELGVIIIETDTLECEWVKIEVPQLIRKTVNSPDEMIKTEVDHTIYELTGNVLDLAKIDKDSELLDKKIVLNESPASLELKNLTIEEELEKYLIEIVKLPNSEVEKVMEVHFDYS